MWFTGVSVMVPVFVILISVSLFIAGGLFYLYSCKYFVCLPQHYYVITDALHFFYKETFWRSITPRFLHTQKNKNHNSKVLNQWWKFEGKFFQFCFHQLVRLLFQIRRFWSSLCAVSLPPPFSYTPTTHNPFTPTYPTNITFFLLTSLWVHILRLMWWKGNKMSPPTF